MLAACSRNLTVPAAVDRTPPTLSAFTASPAFVKQGATLTVTFTSSEELPATAQGERPNPDVQFAGAPMDCTSNALAWVCTLAIDASFEEGQHAVSVAASDAAHNQTTRASAALVTVDFHPPLLAGSESPAPAIKGSATSFIVDSDELLGAAPTVTAAYLTGAPVCAGAIPGTRFVCTGATVAATAAAGTAGFTVSGADQAGNAGSAQGLIALQNPLLPPPRVSVGTVSPNPVNAGTEVTITLTADQPLDLCAASVAGQLAPCAAPAGASCTCRFTVPPSLLEGNNIILGFATNDNGTGTGSGGVQIDNTPPARPSPSWRCARSTSAAWRAGTAARWPGSTPARWSTATGSP